MSNNDKAVGDKTEQDKVKEFIAEYERLCEKHGFNINVQPTFIARDDSTFSVKLVSSVGRLPQKI